MDLSLPRIALLTNNPEKIVAVEGPNKEIKVEKRVKMIPKAWRGEVGVEGKEVGEYLKTKVLSTVCTEADFRFKKWAICWIYRHNHNKDCIANNVEIVQYRIYIYYLTLPTCKSSVNL